MRARRALALIALAPLAASAAGDGAAETAPYDFFDFLGEMVEDDTGEWVDPLDMATLGDGSDGQSDDDDERPLAAAGDDDDE